MPESVRPPQQRRSRESFERVLDSARQLLEENGFEGFTVQEVAARANVSVGAIYERFTSKETLLRTVHGRLMERLVAGEPLEIAAGVAAGDAVETAVRHVAGTMDAHRALLRAFMHLGALDEVISDRGSRESVALGHSFKAALRPYATELTGADPELALDVAFRIAYSTLARHVMYGPLFESDLDLGWGHLTDEVARACTAYLLGVTSCDVDASSD